MSLMLQSTSANKTYFLGLSLTGVTCSGLSKNGGAFASPSSGTVTSLGNGYYAVALDTTDTNTLGDLAVMFAATLGTVMQPPAEQVVAANSIGDLPNDGTAILLLQNLTINNPSGDGVDITATGIGINIIATAGTGINISAGNTGIEVVAGGTSMEICDADDNVGIFVTAGGQAMIVQGGTDGIDITGSGGVGVSITGSTDGVDVTGTANNGIQVNAAQNAVNLAGTSGNALNLVGQQAMQMIGTGASAFQIFSSAGPGLDIQSSSAAAVTIEGATDGVSITGGGTGDVVLASSGLFGNITGLVSTVVLDSSQPHYAPARPGDQMDLVDAPNSPAMIAFASALLNLVDGIETSLTVKQALSTMMAAMSGRVLVSGNTYKFYAPDGVTLRIAATVDVNKQRTTVVITPS